MAMKSDSRVEAVRTALKGAAKDAVSGTREQRSGKFIPASSAKHTAGSELSQNKKK
jgi:hypothetical protein